MVPTSMGQFGAVYGWEPFFAALGSLGKGRNAYLWMRFAVSRARAGSLSMWPFAADQIEK